MPGTDTRVLPNEYEVDSAVRIIFDTLCDRDLSDAAEVKRRMDEYEGDFWSDFLGPAIDQAEGVLFPDGPIEIGGEDA